MWSPPEQLELIQIITTLLQGAYTFNGRTPTPVTTGQTQPPALIRHTAPMMDLRSLIADFWPQDESADDMNAFIYQQRQEDLREELPRDQQQELKRFALLTFRIRFDLLLPCFLAFPTRQVVTMELS